MQTIDNFFDDRSLLMDPLHRKIFIFVIPTIIAFAYFIITNRCKNTINGFVIKGTQVSTQLLEKIKISHDTYIFKFELPKNKTLGIKVGEHVMIMQKIGGELIERKYTPISPVTQKGTFDLLIKIYRPNDHPKFPEGGKLTPWLEKLNENDEISLSGPLGRLNYLSNGRVYYQRMDTAKYVKSSYKNICLIGGGTGITPLYQIIQAVQNNKSDKTNLFLLFANKEEKDILMHQQLNEAKQNGLKLFLTLDNPPANWNYYSGFITTEMLQKSFPKNSNETLFCICGPPPMCNMLIKQLKELKYQNVFKF